MGEEMNGTAASPTNRQIFKVALASIVGSVIEQYDFLVTGVIAATVWGGVFFKLPGLAAVAAAIGVYGIGIIIRPIGAYIFGNLADRWGRKDTLVCALVLMGVSTLLIGLTPTYDSIGVTAPVMLIVFRLIQESVSAPSSAPPRPGWSNRRRDRSTVPSGAPGWDSRFRSDCCSASAR
jgi:MFS family permease